VLVSVLPPFLNPRQRALAICDLSKSGFSQVTVARILSFSRARVGGVCIAL
jgi:hypothetical protein